MRTELPSKDIRRNFDSLRTIAYESTFLTKEKKLVSFTVDPPNVMAIVSEYPSAGRKLREARVVRVEPIYNLLRRIKLRDYPDASLEFRDENLLVLLSGETDGVTTRISYRTRYSIWDASITPEKKLESLERAINRIKNDAQAKIEVEGIHLKRIAGFVKSVDLVRVYGDKIGIRFEFEENGENVFEYTVSSENLSVEEETRSSFDGEYLYAFMRTIQDRDSVSLYLMKDYPIVMDVESGYSELKMTLILAPRLISD